MFVVLLAAAHEGEEFVIALPAVMLVAAIILLKWAASNEASASDASESPSAEAAPAVSRVESRETEPDLV